MTKFAPNEIPCAIPGAKVITILQPYQQDIHVTTTTTPETTTYTATTDTEFAVGKDYYERTGGTGTEADPYTYALTEDTEMQAGKTYYEKKVTPAGSQTVTILYERFTDGMWAVQVKDPGGTVHLEMRQHPSEIFRTTTIVENGNTLLTRDHAESLWEDRETASYIPTCRRLNSDIYGESENMFR